MRVTGDPEQRVLVFDRHEWECFLDGARNGEFDDAAAPGPDHPVIQRNSWICESQFGYREGMTGVPVKKGNRK